MNVSVTWTKRIFFRGRMELDEIPPVAGWPPAVYEGSQTNWPPASPFFGNIVVSDVAKESFDFPTEVQFEASDHSLIEDTFKLDGKLCSCTMSEALAALEKITPIRAFVVTIESIQDGTLRLKTLGADSLDVPISAGERAVTVAEKVLETYGKALGIGIEEETQIQFVTSQGKVLGMDRIVDEFDGPAADSGDEPGYDADSDWQESWGEQNNGGYHGGWRNSDWYSDWNRGGWHNNDWYSDWNRSGSHNEWHRDDWYSNWNRDGRNGQSGASWNNGWHRSRYR